MVDGKDLEMLEKLAERARKIQESCPTADGRPDEELAGIIRDCEQLRPLAHRSRSKAAEALTTGRRILRQLGIPCPSMRPLVRDPDELPLMSFPYAITHHDTAPGPCAGCGAEVPAGPVGWSREAEGGALCDDCLENCCPPLAIVLRFTLVLRELGEVECQTDEELWLLAVNLLNSGRMFEADKIATWVPFPSLDQPELERLLAAIAYRNATAEEDDDADNVH